MLAGARSQGEAFEAYRGGEACNLALSSGLPARAASVQARAKERRRLEPLPEQLAWLLSGTGSLVLQLLNPVHLRKDGQRSELNTGPLTAPLKQLPQTGTGRCTL